METENLYPESRKWIEKITLPAFLISTAFMIIFASNAVNRWQWPWNQLSITVACLIPFFLVTLHKAPKWRQGKEIRLEMFFVPALFILGLLNVVFGEDLQKNFKGMGLFLLTGISIFAAAMYIFNSGKTQKILFWFYSVVLALLSAYSIYGQLWLGFYNPSIYDNPIPESALLSLLLAGPLMLYEDQKTFKGRVLLFSILLVGVAAIVILRQKAAVVSILVVISLLGFFFFKRFWEYFLCTMLVMAFSLKIAYLSYDKLPQTAQGTLNDLKELPLERMEMYFFAYHLIKKKPLIGTGLWAPLTHHLSDYDEKILLSQNSKKRFREVVDRDTTSFHNLILCMFVQMGSVFAIVSLGLFYVVFRKMSQLYKSFPESRNKIKVIIALFTGFFIQSMFVDSLMYPDINLLFYSLLGVMVNFKATCSESLGGFGQNMSSTSQTNSDRSDESVSY